METVAITEDDLLYELASQFALHCALVTLARFVTKSPTLKKLFDPSNGAKDAFTKVLLSHEQVVVFAPLNAKALLQGQVIVAILPLSVADTDRKDS